MSLLQSVYKAIAKPTGPTFAEFVEEKSETWWTGPHRKTSLKKAEMFAGRSGIADCKLSEITHQDITAFTDYLLKERQLKAGTINRYNSTLSTIFHEAVAAGHMETAPRIKWLGEQKARCRYFTDKEQEQLRRFFRNGPAPWIEHFFVLALNTGMRPSEILGIGQDSGFKSKVYGTVTDDGWIDLRWTKNSGSDERGRMVPLNSNAVTALAALDGIPGNHWKSKEFYREWDAARDEIAPGDETFVFYVTRHTFATTMANDYRLNQHVLGELLGHKAAATTSKYVHAKPEALMAAVSKLSDFFSPPAKP